MQSKSIGKYVAMLCFFAALLVLWPNVIHEPLHWLALKMQNLSGTIHFDWSVPAHPYIQKEGQVASIGGGLLYLLLPSLADVLVLVVVWRTRKWAGLLTHIVLPVYLMLVLIINVVKFKSLTSDFHFLVALPSAVWLTLVCSIMLFGSYVVMRSCQIICQSETS